MLQNRVWMGGHVVLRCLEVRREHWSVSLSATPGFSLWPPICSIYAVQCSRATIALFVSAHSMSGNCFKRSVFDRSRALALATVAFEGPDLGISVAPECVRTAPHQVCLTGRTRRTRDRRDVRDVAQDRRRLSHRNNAMRDRSALFVRKLAILGNIFRRQPAFLSG
jgi:hypothetical protein